MSENKSLNDHGGEGETRIFRYLSPGGYSIFDAMVPNGKFLVEVTEEDSIKERDELHRVSS